jgi:hypothetical protein
LYSTKSILLFLKLFSEKQADRMIRRLPVERYWCPFDAYEAEMNGIEGLEVGIGSLTGSQALSIQY